MILTIFHVGRGGEAHIEKNKTFKCTDAGVLITRIGDWCFLFKFKKEHWSFP